MKTWLVVHVFGAIYSTLGPMPDLDYCTTYLGEANRQVDISFAVPDVKNHYQLKWPAIRRQDITIKCQNSEIRPK